MSMLKKSIDKKLAMDNAAKAIETIEGLDKQIQDLDKRSETREASKETKRKV